MGKREWLVAALAAFGVGCGEPGNVERKALDEGDIKDAKVEKAPEEILGQDEVVDEELGVPESAAESGMGKEGKVDEELGTRNEEVDISELEEEDSVESELLEFRNVLMEEADGIKPGDWMGDKYNGEVERLKKKLPKELSKNKFDNSLEQLHKFFVPRKDEAKNKVVGLISTVREYGEKKFIVNEEHRDNVKSFAEKYGAQYGVPVEVIYGVMAVENAGKHDPNKNKADGAYGIMQVQKGVAQHLEELKFNNEDWADTSVEDLESNIRVGTAYLKYLENRYGQWSFALMAYNAGPSAFETKMSGSEEEKIKIRKKEGGWKKWLEDKNFWWACSRNGKALFADGNARYVVGAMYLGPTLGEIINSQGEEVELTPLVEDMK